MINEDSDTFQSDLYQYVEKLNKIFIEVYMPPLSDVDFRQFLFAL
jgi:hypothetical protein